MPKKIVHRTIRYACAVCNEEHRTKKQALACEQMPIEEPQFSVGQHVVAKGWRTCSCGQRYVCKGEVLQLVGPIAFDPTWMHCFGERHHFHVFQFEITGKCSSCKERKRVRYFAPELEAVK